MDDPWSDELIDMRPMDSAGLLAALVELRDRPAAVYYAVIDFGLDEHEKGNAIELSAFLDAVGRTP